ncbi:MAG: hypothetical protein MUE73_15570 [Planctomycetes bacterium]|jgi:hypothetical protein|nr:hypothetical protein [Planctomycetota bacterium]
MDRFAILLALLLALPALAPAAPAEPSPEAIKPEITNLLDDFVAYEAAAREAPPEARDAKWDEMLAAKHPVFFADAIYRRLEGEERAKHRRYCIDTFWKDVAARLPAMRDHYRHVAAFVTARVGAFARQFPDLAAAPPIYLTISFSFRGKQLTVGDREVIGLGLEYFPTDGFTQFNLTLDHEVFHYYHLKYFDGGRGLYRALWQEGMATYVSGLLNPGKRMTEVLGFTPEKVTKCAGMLPAMATELRDNLTSTDHALRRAYFGAEDNDRGIPPEAGYYVGLLLVAALSESRDITELARLSPEQVLALLPSALTALAGEK